VARTYISHMAKHVNMVGGPHGWGHWARAHSPLNLALHVAWNSFQVGQNMK